MASHWVINVDPDHQVRVDSFPLTELDPIAVKYGQSWHELVLYPLKAAGAVQALFDLACGKAGVPSRPLLAAEVLDLSVFAVVDDDGIASEFLDGLPDPKLGATPSTSG